jgi:hypothetical protein
MTELPPCRHYSGIPPSHCLAGRNAPHDCAAGAQPTTRTLPRRSAWTRTSGPAARHGVELFRGEANKMAIRYKTTTMGGKPILSHRKVWIMAFGEIPAGYHVHHINEDKFDNRPENPAILKAEDHCALHGTGKPPPNKGTKYGQTDAYKRSHSARLRNHEEECRRTYELWKSGITQSCVAEICGISRRQVCDRLRSYRNLTFQEPGHA